MAARPAQRLARAVATGRVEDVRAVLDSGIDVNTPLPLLAGLNALHVAAMNGYAELVKLLLDNGAALDEKTPDGATALSLAAKKGLNLSIPLHRNKHIDVVKLLLAAGAAIDHKIEYNLFCLAILKDDPAAVELLGARGVPMDVSNDEVEMGGTPLINSISALDNQSKTTHKMVHALLKAGACPNKKDKKGRSALMHAVIWGHTEVMVTLIKAGAELNETDGTGRTAIMHAISAISKLKTLKTYSDEVSEMIRVLLRNGADANKTMMCTDDGSPTEAPVTALWCAVLQDLESVATILMEAGADANFVNDIDGNSVLMLAVVKGHSGCVKALLKFGCDVHKVNKAGRTALQLAAEIDDKPGGNKKCIIELLKQAGAREHSRQRRE